MLLPTTLCLAAAAAVINIWISMRVGRVRHAVKVSVGDGGDEALVRRMRAHANFIENTPLTLILIAAIDLSGKGAAWLAIVGAIYMLGRVCHALGMDGGSMQALRGAGTAITMLTQLGLAIVAVLIALGHL
ncbi:MAPEG family protein [Novosphingobium sp. G106]|uniref:MAPEG family protein n=1 Tax=Novosphingobium sp. G106 TaxID=2849500 RepID=UPI001C2D73CE|nr:MAPEG family protein [Novosphingobium sp. G106]MBV1687995.1 MAPEG family protein [Novosphingobium sp. G106]